MEKLSRMLTICLIFFASMESTATALHCIRKKTPDFVDQDNPVLTEKPKTDADPTWTLNVYFTTWTLNGTFRVNDFYVNPKPEFKDNRTVLDSKNNVTAVFQTKINSFIRGTIEVDLILDNAPIFLHAADIEFHRVSQKPPDQDAVLPVISSSRSDDPFAMKVRGICYAHECGIRPYWTEYDYEYDLFIQCDRVQPYPSRDVQLRVSNLTAEKIYLLDY